MSAHTDSLKAGIYRAGQECSGAWACTQNVYGNSYYWWYYYSIPASSCHAKEKVR